MRLVALTAAALSLAACAHAPAAPAPTADAPATPAAPAESNTALTTRLLAELGRTQHCDPHGKGARSIYCIAARWDAAGKDAGVAALPVKPVLFGVSMGLPADMPVEEAIEPASGYQHVAALGLRGDETQKFVHLAPLVPSNADEQALVAPAQTALLDLYAGKTKVAAIPKDLAEYVVDLPAAANYPLARVEGGGWRWQGKLTGDVRHIGDAWVSVEVATEGDRGLLVTVFTEAWQ